MALSTSPRRIPVDRRQAPVDLRLRLRVRDGERFPLQHRDEIVPALRGREQPLEGHTRFPIRRIERRDAAPGADRSVEVVELGLAERRDLLEPLLARVGGEPAHPRRDQERLAQRRVVAALAAGVLDQRERLWVGGIHRQDLLRVARGALDVASVAERGHQLAQVREPLVRREPSHGHAERAQRVLLAPRFAVEIDEALGRLGVALLQQPLETRDRVVDLTGLQIRLRQPLAPVRGLRSVRGVSQEGHPAGRQPLRLAELVGDALQQPERAVVVRLGVERRLQIAEAVLRRDLLGDLVEEIRCAVPIGGCDQRVLGALGATEVDAGEVVHDLEVSRRVGERALERPRGALRVVELLGLHVGELAPEGDAPAGVDLGLGLFLQQRRGGFHVAGLAIESRGRRRGRGPDARRARMRGGSAGRPCPRG